MIEAVTIVVCAAALVALATWVLTRRQVADRTTYAVVIRHTKPRGLEVVHVSRSPRACQRYLRAHRLLGQPMVIMTRGDVDAANLATVADPRFWADVADLTKGTPEQVATLARDAALLAARLSRVVDRIGEVSMTDPLTKVDGIPLSPERYEG